MIEDLKNGQVDVAKISEAKALGHILQGQQHGVRDDGHQLSLILALHCLEVNVNVLDSK